MRVIIEGCDGSGKTTLASELKRLVPNAELIHRGPIKSHPLKEYELPKGSFIADRWHVGEMVYGPLFRGKSRLTMPMAHWMELYLESRGVVKVWADAPYKTIRTRLQQRGDDMLHPDDIELVTGFYERYAKSTPGWVAASEIRPEDIVKLANLKIRDRFTTLSVHPSYVGVPKPRALFITPAYEDTRAGAPWPQSAGDTIIRALQVIRYEHIRMIGFVSSNERNLSQLIDRLGDPLIIPPPPTGDVSRLAASLKKVLS